MFKSRFVVPAVVALSVAVMLFRAFKGMAPNDAAYILGAGKAWTAGVDPYSLAFAKFAAPYVRPEMAVWAYPPQWWLPSVLLAQLNDASAFFIWKLLNVVALLASGLILHKTVRDMGERPTAWMSALFAIALLASDVTRSVIALGQTSILILLGFALLMRGVVRDRSGLQISGLVLMLLKPQFGLLFLPIMALSPSTRRLALIALAVTVALCLPILFQFGVSGTLNSAAGLLHNLSTYGTMKWNRPLELGGLPFVMALAGLPAIPTLACVGIAAAISVVLVRKAPENLWLYPVAIAFAVIPLHGYDFMMLPVFLLFMGRFELQGRVLIIAANVLCWREASAYSVLMSPSESWHSVWLASIVAAGLVTLAAILLVVALALPKAQRNIRPARLVNAVR